MTLTIFGLNLKKDLSHIKHLHVTMVIMAIVCYHEYCLILLSGNNETLLESEDVAHPVWAIWNLLAWS